MLQAYLFGAIFLCFGLFTLLIGVCRLAILRYAQGALTTGSVVRFEEHPNPDGVTYSAVARFQVADRTFEAKSLTWSSSPIYRYGQAVSVRYDPISPDKAEIVSRGEFAVAWYAILAGFAFVAIAAWLFVHPAQ